MAEMNDPTVDSSLSKPKGITVNLPVDLLKSLCFNCDNRSHCSYVEKRKIYCELFE